MYNNASYIASYMQLATYIQLYNTMRSHALALCYSYS